MFKKILIANRGEQLAELFRPVKMGIKTVAIYSDADENALHADLATKPFVLGIKSQKVTL